MADRVTTDNDVQLGGPNEMINRMDLEATYKHIDWKVPANYQRRLAAEKWEAMIPERIEPELIGGL
ncbi:hypothetical protein SAMN04488060_0874 [Qipengyuania nanhaisediminis]|uniref:Uncharacterized protein n=2 Tax=Qipengyuania nanhaisediminis TaxID=604088 RepID=A0A1I5LB02_9SPHN|nr:hypothetical protein SAMN04488060_0874 [Qipengyuania nanhaisediminis]